MITLELSPEEVRTIVNSLEYDQTILLENGELDEASVMAGILLKAKPLLLKYEGT